MASGACLWNLMMSPSRRRGSGRSSACSSASSVELDTLRLYRDLVVSCAWHPEARIKAVDCTAHCTGKAPAQMPKQAAAKPSSHESGQSFLQRSQDKLHKVALSLSRCCTCGSPSHSRWTDSNSSDTRDVWPAKPALVENKSRSIAYCTLRNTP